MEDLHAYLKEKEVREIFKELMENLVQERPANVHAYIVNYIQENYADSLEDVMVKYEDDDEYEEEEDDILPEMPEAQSAAPKGRRRRSAVSAESMDPTEMKNKKKTVIEKTEEDRAIVLEKLSKCFLFSALDKDAFNSLVDAVAEKKFSAGDYVMKQGDDGDYFYIIEEGGAQIFVNSEDEGEKMVKECEPGDSFGELALMYNAPRAASIKATADLKCWAVDRETFKLTLMESTIDKRTKYEKFLDEVPILETLYKYEKLTIADALKPVEYSQGDVVMEQGAEGDMFYIIEAGSVDFSQEGAVVGSAAEGGYFGEIALLTNDKRKATVTCTSDCTLLSLDRKTFVRVMGPLDNVLKRNMTMYKNYQQN